MTTKATRDVLDMAVREVNDFVLNGIGTASIDATPIGNTAPDVGFFTNVGVGNITITASADFTGATITGLSSYYADLAEYYEADEALPKGTVVKIGGDKEIQATNIDADPDVFGVVSSDPAFVMNQPSTDGNHAAIALVGRVPCRVLGPVTKGSRLVANSDGQGMDASRIIDGPSFARSLETCDRTDERLIEVAIVTVK